MNNFNNAIQVITTRFNVTADIRNDVARMQVPAVAWRELWTLIRKNTGRVWWTAEDDIINVYTDRYDFVMSKRTGRITITNMFFDVFDLEANGLNIPMGECQGKEISNYFDNVFFHVSDLAIEQAPKEQPQVVSANLVHTLDAHILNTAYADAYDEFEAIQIANLDSGTITQKEAERRLAAFKMMQHGGVHSVDLLGAIDIMIDEDE